MAIEEKVKVGLVGAGWIGQHHGTNIAKNPHAELAAVCDDTPHTISFAHEPHITLVVLTNSLTGYGGTNFSMAADKRLWVMWDIERENAMKTNLTVWGISQ